MAGPGFSAQVSDLQRRLRRARERGESQQLDILMQDLETAVEELRVADEEVRTQQQEVARLLENQQLLRWRHERMLSILPIPVLTTDRHGRLLSLNTAGAALFGVRVDHLLRKPIFSFVAEDERRTLRTTLGDAVRHGTTRRQDTRLRLRDHTLPVTAYVARSPQSQDEVTWLLVGGSDDVGEDLGSEQAGALPEALLTLFALSGRGFEPRDVIQQAAYVVAETLGPGTDVSLVLGSPLDPGEIASTSLDAQVLDRWQLESRNGPCVVAYHTGKTVLADDLDHDQRWSPRPATDDSPAVLTAAVVVPLVDANDRHGVLAAYLHRGRPPSASTVESAKILAAAITSVLQEMGLRTHIESLATDMRDALASRSTIEQAKGIVMAAKHCSADEAFHHLVMLSNTGHVKLREVARQVVAGAGG
jgi:PAS domain S-box-containing protein